MLLVGSIAVLAATRVPQEIWNWTRRNGADPLLSEHTRRGSYGAIEAIEDNNGAEFSENYARDFQIISKPPSPGDRGRFALEGVCLVGEVLIQVLLLVPHFAESTQWLSLGFWIYLLALFCVRFWCLKFHVSSPGYLWYHFPVAYFMNFVCSGILLWLQPDYQHICEFTLGTLLFYAIGTVRSGNGTVNFYKSPNRTPSPEPVSSLFSKATFSYVIPLLRLGRQRPLKEPDVWDLPLEEHASYSMYRLNKFRSKDVPLLWRVAREVMFPILLSSLYSALASALLLMPSFFVRHILEYMDDPETHSKTLAWVYTFGIFVCSFSESILYNHANFLSQRISVRLRALLMSLVYSKSLKRRLVDVSSDDGKEEVTEQEGGDDEVDESEGLPSQPSSGTIINLMSVDASRIAEETTQLPRLVSAIVQLIVGFYFLYLAMGRSGLVGIGGMAIVAPTIYFISEQYAKLNSKLLTYSDKRVEKANELFQGIRILKYLGWEFKFADTVKEIRDKEIDVLKKLFIIDSIGEGVYVLSPILVTVLTFGWYTLFEGHELTSPIAFSTLVVLNVIKDPMSELSEIVSDFFRATVSIRRIRDFLNQEETTKFDQLSSWYRRGVESPYIGFENASFSWGIESTKLNSRSYYDFKLFDLDIDFPTGKLTLVMGPTGSGKSSLLLALLGEMDLVKGKVFLPGLGGRENARIDRLTGLCETVAYCPQNPWLVSDTVRHNIIFASDFDQGRYNAVLDACELTHDLEILDDGDNTLVGERGITLSGGQKQRISIARAMYSRSKYILLDDCLSAVDANTALEIYNNCLTGPISESRTVILVSHNVSLATSKAEKVVIMDDGHVVAQGRPEELSNKGLLEFGSKRKPLKKAPDNPTEGESSDSDESLKLTEGNSPQNKTAIIEEETMASGDVGVQVYWNYIKAMGPYWFPFVMILILAIEQGGDVVQNWWLQRWSEGKGKIATAINNNGGTTIYYMSIYFGLGLLSMMYSVLQKLIFLFGGVRASRKLFNNMMQSILRTTVRFYDSTPVGRIMNRFSNDMESIDFMVAQQLADFGQTIFVTVTTLVLVTYITPLFIIPGTVIVMVYWAFFQYYLQTSRELKRIESVTHSPVYQHFGETLSGLSTIRAYGDQNRFIRENMQKIDTTNRPDFYTWLTGAWVCFWVDVLGGLVSFTTAVFLLLNTGKIDAGLAGFSLSYATFFGYRLYYAFHVYARLQIEMNSAERVKEYTELKSEPPLVVPGEQVPHTWPDHGEILFENVNLRYAPDLPLVVKDLTFKVDPGSKVGVIGRTGAGKSTIITSLFRFIEADSGRIIIDGIDISKIGLQTVRQSISIIPQDPTLFTGTIRTNLDPFNSYSNADIYQALRRVHLVDGEDGTQTSHNKFADLNTSVLEGGLNFSQGQRQLLCLARALLSRPKILLLDEATASIDYATDSKIQRTIREEFANATLITVAHRIHSIVDYDKILVMERGQAVEYDAPQVLLEQDSKFRDICLETGEIKKLEAAAKGSK